MCVCLCEVRRFSSWKISTPCTDNIRHLRQMKMATRMHRAERTGDGDQHCDWCQRLPATGWTAAAGLAGRQRRRRHWTPPTPRRRRLSQTRDDSWCTTGCKLQSAGAEVVFCRDAALCVDEDGAHVLIRSRRFDSTMRCFRTGAVIAHTLSIFLSVSHMQSVVCSSTPPG